MNQIKCLLEQNRKSTRWISGEEISRKIFGYLSAGWSHYLHLKQRDTEQMIFASNEEKMFL